jgi:hypothetical protein
MQPAPHKRVFVTSSAYAGDFKNGGTSLTGLAAADYVCNVNTGSLGIPGTFVAWLSTSTVNAIDRVTGDGPWYLLDDTLAFPDHQSLAGTPLVPIHINELGLDLSVLTPPKGLVWTGTAVGGKASSILSGPTTCADWTDGTASSYGGSGNANAQDAYWTDLGGGSAEGCSAPNRIYCFQIN